ncbi:MFS transporter [Phycisphaera mikurensis]|uniref:Putative major facilitator superfamily protein n=1 Tax=Phycisphaera mikurensis (strain NBRC 102666 / KCTC 22515 / FYK2301M01) TaxID=1142394 RepID=I0IIC4_PHYMF|nr:MFS transporter [Phycisphaera mikurensis]MBB6442424.1 PPP family 3-phenylpropionic acid transporter [Phycisphaera mikurensis]BAM05012.1 putative major facilitator superfamily protein [Phycisphaera mikurensis NBRC 102666]
MDLSPLRRQYFFTYMVMGSIAPFISVWLREQGLSKPQVGSVMTLTGAAVLVTPVITTAFADAAIATRRIVGGCFALAILALAGLSVAGAAGAPVVLIGVLYGLYALTQAPLPPLQDGLFFRTAGAGAGPGSRYHRTRVFGTVGFIGPSLVLFFWLRETGRTDAALHVGAVAAGLGLLNAFTLPSDRAPAAGAAGAAPAEPAEKPKRRGASLPTVAAARAVARDPVMLAYWAAMWLLAAVSGSYYSFYPLYLTEAVGIGREWVGLISNLGVLVELGFMLAFGRLVGRFGLQAVVLAGVAAVLVRMVLLAAFPTPAVAVGTQAFHGLMVLLLFVTPPVFLNARAQESFRSSIQGLFAMLVFGTGRMTGTFTSGWISEGFGLPAVYAAASAAALLAGVVLLLTPLGGRVEPAAS